MTANMASINGEYQWRVSTQIAILNKSMEFTSLNKSGFGYTYGDKLAESKI